MSELEQILTECREYFEGGADAEYFTDRASPVPNEEMRLMVRCDEGLALVKVLSTQAKPE